MILENLRGRDINEYVAVLLLIVIRINGSCLGNKSTTVEPMHSDLITYSN